MTLEQASYFSQIIGAAAVLASLLFVGFQIRQNTKSQHVVAVDSLAAAIAAINVPAMSSPALGEALAKALGNWSAASREQRIVAHYFLFSYFKLAENAWYQRQSNVLDEAQWSGWNTMMRSYFHAPGVQQVWWPRRRDSFSPAFQAYLAGTAMPEGSGTLDSMFDDVVMK